MAMSYGPEIASVGEIDLFPVSDQHGYSTTISIGAGDSWAGRVATIPGADLARSDEDLAAEIVSPHRTSSSFNVGTPKYEGSKQVPPSGALKAGTVFTYSVPFKGDVKVLTGPAQPPKRILKATIDGDGPQKRILFSYRAAQDVPDVAAKVQAQFENDYQTLKAAIAQREDEAETARARAHAEVMRSLQERRAREQRTQTTDQDMQARLNAYLNK